MGGTQCHQVTAAKVRAMPIVAGCHPSAPVAEGQPDGIGSVAHAALAACNSVERGCIQVDNAAASAVRTATNGCTPLPASAAATSGNYGGGLTDMAFNMFPTCDSFSTLGQPTPRGLDGHAAPGSAAAAAVVAKRKDVPPFTSPASAIAEGDGAAGGAAGGAEAQLHAFVAQVAAGVGLVLHVEGAGALSVRVSLDRHCTALQLTFMGVEKVLPFSMIGGVTVKQGCLAEEQFRTCWLAELALTGQDVATFVFEANDQGRQDAQFFATCLRELLAKMDKRKETQGPMQPQPPLDLVSAPLEPVTNVHDEPLLSLDP